MYKRFFSKHIADCYALANLINRLDPGNVTILHNTSVLDYSAYSYIWHFFEHEPCYGCDAKLIRVNSKSLMWHKFFSGLPAIKSAPGLVKYDIGFSALSEPSGLLDLLDSSKFTSASIGLSRETHGIRGHACCQPIKYSSMGSFLASVKAVLIYNKGISHPLCEAIFYNRPILMARCCDNNRNLGFDWSKYVSTSACIENALKNYDEEAWLASQASAAEFIKEKAYQIRLQPEKYMS